MTDPVETVYGINGPIGIAVPLCDSESTGDPRDTDGIYVFGRSCAFDLRWFPAEGVYRRRMLDADRYGDSYSAETVREKLASGAWSPAFAVKLGAGTYRFEPTTP